MTTKDPERPSAPTRNEHDGPRGMTRIDGTNRTTIQLLLAVVAAFALAHPEHARAGELDGMPPDLFAHYAKSRLSTLAGTANAARKIEREFDAKCRTTREAKQRSSDCEVARDARRHLEKLMAEEREVMEHLRRDGQPYRGWISAEDREFWTQVRAAPDPIR